jgi:sugar phosphate isomerase/epimerase
VNSVRLACCNFLPEVAALKEFALTQGFDGVDWSFFPEDLPGSPAAESSYVKAISLLHPLEVRYHCPFNNMDLGNENPAEAQKAKQVFRRVCRLVSKVGGRVLTIHIGLGLSHTLDLCWERTVKGLADLVSFANHLGVRLCLENLALGWTSRPELFEKLLRTTNVWGTIDIGHAQVSPSVESRLFRVADFVMTHPERFLNAHVYHEERASGHLPPQNLSDLWERLLLLQKLPLCTWWVLELREEAALLQTLAIVREFLNQGSRSLARS